MKKGFAQSPSPAKREREGPIAKRWEGEGGETQSSPFASQSFSLRENEPSPASRSARGTLSRGAGEGLSATVEQHLRDYFAAHERELPASGLYDRVIQEIERPLLAITLDECRGNQLRAAALLGLNRNTLRKKIRELGLHAGRQRKKGAANDD